MKALVLTLEEKKEEREEIRRRLKERAKFNNLNWLEEQKLFESSTDYQSLENEIRVLEKTLIECLFGFRKEVSRASNLVTDKKEAIELLCMTTTAWRLLDESLKSDPEVIMYLQPLGHKDVVLYNTTKVLGQRGFEVVNEEALSRPKINFPEGFDYETYFQIQSELRRKTLDIFVDPFVEQTLFDYANEDGDIKDVKLKLYDRSLLSDIVAKYYAPSKEVVKASSVKTIGTHPEMK